MRPLLHFFWPARGCMQKINKIKEKHSCMQIRFLCVAGDTSQYQYPTIRNWHHLFWQCLAQPIRVSLAFLIWMPSEQGHVGPWPMRSCMSVSGWAKLGKQGSASFSLTHWLKMSHMYSSYFLWWFKLHCWTLNTCPKYVRTKYFIMIQLKVKKEGMRLTSLFHVVALYILS